MIEKLGKISILTKWRLYCEKIYISYSFDHYLVNVTRRSFEISCRTIQLFRRNFPSHSENSVSSKMGLKFWEPIKLSFKTPTNTLVSPKLLAGATLNFNSIFLSISTVYICICNRVNRLQVDNYNRLSNGFSFFYLLCELFVCYVLN